MSSINNLKTLFKLGAVIHDGEWLNYLDYGLSKDDVPGLLSLVGDKSLHEADVDTDDAWVPLHAWRALGQLGSTACVEPLIDLFDLLVKDDWGFDDLPLVMAMLGEPAIEPLITYLKDASHDEFALVLAGDGLKEIAIKHPEFRERVVEALTDCLTLPTLNTPTMNALIVCCLIDLKATESIEAIRELYQSGNIDITCVGDIEDLEIALDLRSERTTPSPNYGALHQMKQQASSTEAVEKNLYEEIDGYLATYGGEKAILDSSELDGFFTALASAPQAIMPSQWFSAIWGGEAYDPDWPNQNEANDFITGVMVHYNQVAKALHDNAFHALYLEREIDGKNNIIVDEWCAGYLRGLNLWGPLPPHDIQTVDALLEPMRIFSTEKGHEEIGTMDAETIEFWQQKVEANAGQLYKHFLTRRTAGVDPIKAGTNIGRNDLCPCGSGKKFKKCCLH